ncbi:hypothetical protein K449DRAFT_156347 [Hypoxylon sp. EC38]|nr:hypothetical protein K449DRAFT_156347 [Hypoxylon sp. EC38]
MQLDAPWFAPSLLMSFVLGVSYLAYKSLYSYTYFGDTGDKEHFCVTRTFFFFCTFFLSPLFFVSVTQDPCVHHSRSLGNEGIGHWVEGGK